MGALRIFNGMSVFPPSLFERSFGLSVVSLMAWAIYSKMIDNYGGASYDSMKIWLKAFIFVKEKMDFHQQKSSVPDILKPDIAITRATIL